VADDPLEGCTGFDWDDGNLEKNWDLHRVPFWEAEEIFFNEPLVIVGDNPYKPNYLEQLKSLGDERVQWQRGRACGAR